MLPFFQMPSLTIFNLLSEAAEQYGDAPALHQPRTEGGNRKLHTYSWKEYRQAAEEIAAGLRSLRIQKGDVVALNSETRLEFYICDLGIISNGSIAAALYPNYPPADLVRTLQACDAKAAFVENPAIFESLRSAPVKTWILMTGQAEGALSLESLRERGRRAIAEDKGLIERIVGEIEPSDPAILYLTSGATGEPKMALVSHQAVLSNVAMGPQALPMSPQDATVAFLPSAHIAQRIVMEMLPIPGGMPVTFAESLLRLPQDIKAVRPTIFLAPPRMWERVYATICTEIRKRPAAVQKLFYGALGLGLAAAKSRREGKRVPVHISWPLKLADRLVFKQIRARFGGRMRVPVSGAAPLSPDLAEFYEAIGMAIVEGYGLTEGGVVTFNPIDAPRPGSIGKALPGVELRVAEDSELLVKSPCLFLGYYKDPKATADVLRDGWLHTGDIGYRDEDGYFYVTGRKKEMIVSSTGKKIYPSRVESLFKTEPLISQVLLIGDRLPYLTALFTINPTVAESLAGIDGYRGLPAADLVSAPPVLSEVQRIVSRVNKQLAQFEQIRRFRVLPRDFSIENGELTATMKVRRTQVLANFRAEVDELYQGKES